MAKWKDVLFHDVSVQIIIAIITTVIGGSAIANFIISEFLKPNMDIEVTVDEKDLHNATINIINEGRASASKFILTLQAPQNISSYNVFTTDNYTADYVENSTSLELYFPRFTYGEGSLIRVNMSLDNKSNITSGYYTAYATYDQGSYKKVLPITQISLSFDERFREFWRVNGSLISLIVGIITSFTLLLTLKKIRRSGKEIPGK